MSVYVCICLYMSVYEVADTGFPMRDGVLGLWRQKSDFELVAGGGKKRGGVVGQTWNPLIYFWIYETRIKVHLYVYIHYITCTFIYMYIYMYIHLYVHTLYYLYIYRYVLLVSSLIL